MIHLSSNLFENTNVIHETQPNGCPKSDRKQQSNIVNRHSLHGSDVGPSIGIEGSYPNDMVLDPVDIMNWRVGLLYSTLQPARSYSLPPNYDWGVH